MLFEDEDESTRARGRGQFPKFGAMRKKAAADFCAGAAIKKLLWVFDSSMCSAVHLAVSKREKESVEVDRNYFHSRCTGNAERQLLVLSSRLSVRWRRSAAELRSAGQPGRLSPCELGRVWDPALHKVYPFLARR